MPFSIQVCIYQELRFWFTVCYGVEVVINGATKEIGRAVVVAMTNARGMEVAGAVDSHLVGQDIGQVPPYLNLQLYQSCNTFSYS